MKNHIKCQGQKRMLASQGRGWSLSPVDSRGFRRHGIGGRRSSVFWMMGFATSFNFHATQSRMWLHVANLSYLRLVLEWQEGQNQLLPRLHPLSDKLGYVATIPCGHTTQERQESCLVAAFPLDQWWKFILLFCFNSARKLCFKHKHTFPYQLSSFNNPSWLIKP